MKEFKIYTAGEFVKTENKLEVVNPFTKKTFAKTYLAGKTELEKCIKEAKSVEKELKDMPSHKRYQILMQISEGLKKNRKELAETLVKQSGKPLKYSY